MNDNDPDTIQLLMWIEKLEQKISKLEREIIDIKNSLKKPVKDETRQSAERTGKTVK
jgi:uncharacterized small protein (DUF1192 family)